MRVLVTRPEPDAQVLAETLRRLGHEPMVAPLLTVMPGDHPLPDDWKERTLLFTSANGARMAKARGLSAPCYVVGDATAAAARAAGFKVAGAADGDVAALAALAAESLPRSTRLLHVSGAHAAGDLIGLLAAQGFDARRFTAYTARAARRLPPAAQAFMAGPAGAALLFSPRTAAVLVRLVAQSGLAADAQKHRALALSATVAKEAAAIPWRAIETAGRPAQDALLSLL